MADRKTPDNERRAHPRVPHPTRAVLSTGRGELVADVFDVSVGGVGLDLEGDVHRGEFVRVRLPLQPEDDTEWVDPDAVVVRVKPNAKTGRNTVGLSFHQLAADTKQEIAQRVAAAAPVPETPTQRFMAKPRGEDAEAARRALRDAVAGSPAPPRERRKPSAFVQRLSQLFARRSEPGRAPKRERQGKTKKRD